MPYDVHPEDKDLQLKALSCDLVQTVTIECNACSETEEVHASTLEGAADQFYSSGWRQINTKYFGFIGVVCPDCANKTEEERAEDDI